MKAIGLLGGMSWQSTQLYYRMLNEGTAARLGGSHSARCIVYSFDFAPIEAMQQQGNWDALGAELAAAARSLRAAGAELVLIGANTMHRVAPYVESAIDVPLLHIADAAAHEMQRAGCTRPALLGTRYTMEGDFYAGRLRELFGLDALIPNDDEREILHRIIYEELIRGDVREASRLAFASIVDRLVDSGADCVLLACTELGMIYSQADASVPVIDTAAAHVAYALQAAFDEF